MIVCKNFNNIPKMYMNRRRSIETVILFFCFVLQFIGNVRLTCNHIDNSSHIYKVNPETESQVHKNLPQNDTRFALLANFFTSNGLKGEVCFYLFYNLNTNYVYE